MTITEFIEVLGSVGIKADRVEISTGPSGFQACIRVGKKIHFGAGRTDDIAIEACISDAQLGKPWSE